MATGSRSATSREIGHRPGLQGSGGRADCVGGAAVVARPHGDTGAVPASSEARLVRQVLPRRPDRRRPWLANLLRGADQKRGEGEIGAIAGGWTDCFLRSGAANRPGVQVTPARSPAIRPSHSDRLTSLRRQRTWCDLTAWPRRNHGVREPRPEQISPRAQQNAGVGRGRLRTAFRAAVSPSGPSHRSKPWRASLLREASHSLPSARIRLCTMLRCPANMSRRLSLEGERCGIQLAGGR